MGKALFFDIDGTLLDSRFKVPESTKLAIEKLKENGHKCFICTGRTRNFVVGEQLLSLDFDGIVAGCGTYIEHDGRVVFNREIERELLERTVDVLKEHDVPSLLEGCKNHYLNEVEFMEDPYLKILKSTLGDTLLDLDGTRGTWAANKLTVNTRSHRWGEAKEKLAQHFQFVEHEEDIAEMVPRGFDKAEGIRRCCELLEINHADTFAFGDSANDIEMLEFAHVGIAMGNATKEAKEAADYVTSDIHEDGIYNAVKHFGLI